MSTKRNPVLAPARRLLGGGVLATVVLVPLLANADTAAYQAVTTEHLAGGTYELNAGGRLHAATIGLRPPFDPANRRVRP